MPFKSERQRKYLWARHPKIARRWTDEAKAKKTVERVRHGKRKA